MHGEHQKSRNYYFSNSPAYTNKKVLLQGSHHFQLQTLKSCCCLSGFAEEALKDTLSRENSFHVRYEIPRYVLFMIGNIAFQLSKMLDKIIRKIFTCLEITKQVEWTKCQPKFLKLSSKSIYWLLDDMDFCHERVKG